MNKQQVTFEDWYNKLNAEKGFVSSKSELEQAWNGSRKIAINAATRVSPEPKDG